jgi:hypothetical protein
MAENSFFLLPTPAAPEKLDALSAGKSDWLALVQVATGYALIMGTIWTVKTTQRWFFWISAAWFLVWALTASWKAFRRGVKLPSLKVSALVVLAGAMVAGSFIALAATLGTLHGLFGRKDPLLHAGSYMIWAIIQQIIQQTFFLTRFEQLTQSGLRASLIAASLFGLAHLPNPVLAPVTLAGGWLMSELYLRYRTVLPLGIAHGLVGMSIAVSVPDHIQHHMRVGLSYLLYPR